MLKLLRSLTVHGGELSDEVSVTRRERWSVSVMFCSWVTVHTSRRRQTERWTTAFRWSVAVSCKYVPPRHNVAKCTFTSKQTTWTPRTSRSYETAEHVLLKHSLCVVVDGVVANKQRGVESFGQQRVDGDHHQQHRQLQHRVQPQEHRARHHRQDPREHKILGKTKKDTLNTMKSILYLNRLLHSTVHPECKVQ